MLIRRNRFYRPIFRCNERGILIVTRKWVIAAGTYAFSYA